MEGGDAAAASASAARSGNAAHNPGPSHGSNGGGGVPRHTSLEREVYYSKDNERKEVVTYSKFGKSVCGRFNMSREEEKAYKDSMQDLCSLLKRASSEKLDGKKGRGRRGLPQDKGDDAVGGQAAAERRALSREPIDEEDQSLGHAVSRTSIYSEIDLD